MKGKNRPGQFYRNRNMLIRTCSRKCGLCGVLMWSPRWDQHGGDYWHQATIDHIIPIAKGGKSHKENLQVMCRGCNHAKADAERLFVLEDA